MCTLWHEPLRVRRSVNICANQGVVDPVRALGNFAKAMELTAGTFDLQDFFEDTLARPGHHETP